MGVYIPNMEMPKNCNECRFAVDGWCYANPKQANGEALNKRVRTNWCPLRPLPEKHGPLIDRNELEKAVLKWLPPDPCGREEMEYPFETDICVSMMMEIGEQETIVEAEGE